MMLVKQPEMVVSRQGEASPLLALRLTSEEELANLLVEPEAISSMVPHDRARLRRPADLHTELGNYESCFLWGVYAFENDGAETLVGVATLAPVLSRRQEVGLAITTRQHHGKGLGAGVLTAVAACAFDRTQCRQLYADPLECNTPMMRLLERTGFIRCDEGADLAGMSPQSWQTRWALPRAQEDALMVDSWHLPPDKIVKACATFAARKAGLRLEFTI